MTQIVPRSGWRMLNLGEMWRFRELLYFLTWRDIKVRYKQALLGVAWVVLQPLAYMLICYMIFSRMADAPSDHLPYPLFNLCGLVLWMFFSTAVTQAGNSVIGSESLITKVYFPRLAIPFSSVSAVLFDLAILFGMLLAVIGYYVLFTAQAKMVSFGWELLLVLPVVMLTVLAALGVGTMLAALNVAYRDFKHVIPILVQLWLFATPAIFWGSDFAVPITAPPVQAEQSAHSTPPVNRAAASPAANAPAAQNPPARTKGSIPSWVKQALKFNPMTGLVQTFRAALLGLSIPWTQLMYSATIVIVTFVASCFYFHRVEDSFADII
ncbi:MAG: ABC transporter permease [Planctomycetes bacterium]|nr:ABC transporter permease [Planctomycetota bacterium]